MERKKALMDIVKKIDDRRNSLLDIADRSENEVARAILQLSTEICELEKLIAIFLMKP